jgi:hypothetical protein
VGSAGRRLFRIRSLPLQHGFIPLYIAESLRAYVRAFCMWEHGLQALGTVCSCGGKNPMETNRSYRVQTATRRVIPLCRFTVLLG